MSLIFDYPAWYILFCIATGVLYAFILYRRSTAFGNAPGWLVPTLGFLRALFITIIAIFLLNPLLRSLIREKKKPVIVFAQDNSSSILLSPDSSFYLSKYKDDVALLLNELSKDFEVVKYSFGNNTRPKIDFSYSDKSTDFLNLFETIEAGFSGANLGGIIIASDGLYNKGPNPVFATHGISAPIYSIGLGDTNVNRDLVISGIKHNKLVFKGNSFPVEILIQADQCKGEQSVVNIYKNGKSIFSKEFNIENSKFNSEIKTIITAEGSGIQKYTIVLDKINGELSFINNKTDLFIDVIDTRQKILILYNAPHPDIGSIRGLLERNDNYETSLFNVADFKGSVNDYNLVIFYQLPSGNINLSSLIKEKSGSVSYFFITGTSTDLNKLNPLELGFKFTPSNGNPNEATPSINEDFSLFGITGEMKDFFKKSPPLISPHGSYKLGSSSSVFLNQRIGSVNTDYPMLMFSLDQERKTGILFGEGIWKWNLRDFAENGDNSRFESFIGKTIQYLSVKADKSNFRVYGNNKFSETESVIFDSELYNESFELINDPEVNFLVEGINGKNFPFTFARTDKSYRLNAGILPAGEYKYKASVNYKGKEYVKRGEFSIYPLFIENVRAQADHQLLFNLAEKTGGSFVSKNKLNSIPELIKSRKDLKTISVSRKKIIELINLKWICFLITGLISLEWFMRKYFGSY